MKIYKTILFNNMCVRLFGLFKHENKCYVTDSFISPTYNLTKSNPCTAFTL